MPADAYSRQGTSHEKCQDYALTFNSNGVTGIAVLDGCSSSEDSDFGARLLGRLLPAALAQAWVTGWPTPETIVDLLLSKAQPIQQQLQLQEEALDATLLVFAINPAVGQGLLLAWGDGYFGIDDVWTRLSYSDNAPAYPNYRMSTGRLAAYRQMYKGQLTGQAGPYVFQTWQGTLPQRVWLGTDGWDSLGVEGQPALLEAAQPQNLAGSFVQRRMKRCFRDHKNWLNWDDVSLAGWTAGP